MIVMKFDAGSIASDDRLRAVARLVQQNLARRPLVVTSALPKVTDLLLQGAHEACARNGEYEDRLQELKHEHDKIARGLLPDGPVRRRLLGHLGGLLDELRTFYTAVYSLEELTPRTLDAVAAIGERLSCELVVAALVQLGLRAQAVDGRTVLITDEAFCAATPLMEETEQRARIHLKPMVDTGVIPVLGGFMGATQQGVTTTLGRGGADGTAAILGAVLGAQEIQIWTEGAGMTTVDPRLAAGAKVIPQLSPEEAAELAYFGTKVLHPVMIRPAIERGHPGPRARHPGACVRRNAGEPAGEPGPLGPVRGRPPRRDHRAADLAAAHADGLGLPGAGVRGVRAAPHADRPDRHLRGLGLGHGRQRRAPAGDQGRAGAAGRGADPARDGDRRARRPRLLPLRRPRAPHLRRARPTSTW